MIRILIADDIAENRYLLETLLKGNGFDVVSAANGAEALDLARKSAPDLIITDILMPVMDGFALCRQWKADERLRKIPFIVYTATYTEPKDEAFALSLGVDRFIVKPKRPDEMIATLRVLLDDVCAGRLPLPDLPRPVEGDFLRDHNATLLRKLEKKMDQLERTNKILEQEIAEKQGVQKELVFQNTLLKTEQETSLDAILVVDAEGKVLSYNRRFLDLWEIPAEVMDTKSDERALQSVLDKIVEPERFLEKVKDLYRNKDQTSKDIITLRDGRILDRYSSPVVGEDGRYYGRVWYFRDISEQQKLEEQLRQAQKMEAIGLLAGGVAHDFNNILTAIIGYGSILQKKIPQNDPLRDSVDQILESGNRAAQLTSSLLAFSRKQVMFMKPAHLNDIVAGQEKFLRRIIGEDIDMKTILHRDAVIMADRSQIQLILMNLATNARDAMPKGGSLAIETDTTDMPGSFTSAHGDGKPGTYALITVTDTGIGMDTDTQQKIFDPFFTTKEVGRGTGLGMAIIYGIVKQHRGYINVYSEPGRGTTFRIYLPVHHEQVEATAKPLPPAPVLSGTETILLAEDDATLQTFFKNILTEYGYTVVVAKNGEEAVRMFAGMKDTIKLVILDMIMPKMSGRDVYEAVQKIKPGTKVIFSSGYTADKVQKEGLPAGSEFVAKPAAPHIYLRKIREVLDGQGRT